MPQAPGLPIERLRAALAHSYAIDRELGRGNLLPVPAPSRQARQRLRGEPRYQALVRAM